MAVLVHRAFQTNVSRKWARDEVSNSIPSLWNIDNSTRAPSSWAYNEKVLQFWWRQEISYQTFNFVKISNCKEWCRRNELLVYVHKHLSFEEQMLIHVNLMVSTEASWWNILILKIHTTLGYIVSLWNNITKSCVYLQKLIHITFWNEIQIFVPIIALYIISVI